MSDRFDLEQSILDCWKITEDIYMLNDQGADIADTYSLAAVYEYKFQKLWNIFEELVKDRNIT